MKILIISLACIMYSTFTIAQKHYYEPILEIPWNTENGIETEWNYMYHSGIQSFKMLSNNKVAVYGQVNQAIKIYDIQKDSNIISFNLPKRGFQEWTYDTASYLFYIYFNRNIHVYCYDGTFIKQPEINKKIIFNVPYSLDVIDSKLYYSTSVGIYQLANKGEFLPPKQQLQYNLNFPGIIAFDSMLYDINNIDGNKLYFEYGKLGEERTKMTAYFNHEIRSASLLAIRGGRLYFKTSEIIKTKDGQKFYTRIIEISKVTGNVLSEIVLPNIKYVYLEKRIEAFNNNIYYLLTTPENAKLFKLLPDKIEKNDPPVFNNIAFPPSLDYEYNYMDEIDKHVKKKTSPEQGIGSSRKLKSTAITPEEGSIMRSQIMDRAYKYERIQWLAEDIQNLPTDWNSTADNPVNDINYGDCNDYDGITIPGWIEWGTSYGEYNTSMPYKWGGFTHYNDWNDLVGRLYERPSHKRIPGDLSSAGSVSVSDECVIGVDCSGLVSRAWNLTTKRNTTGLVGIADEIEYDELQPGDILDRPDHHVMIFVSHNPTRTNQEYTVIHSEGATHGRVIEEYKSNDYVSDYTPYRYENLLDYDLYITNIQVNESPLEENDGIDVDITIENTGSESYIGRMRAQLYELERDDVDDLETDVMQIGNTEIASVFNSSNVTYNFSDDFVPNNLSGLYGLVLEYEDDDGNWQYIPNENYENYNGIPVHCLVVTGTVFDQYGQPEVGTRIRIRNRFCCPLKSTSNFVKNTDLTDKEGRYLVVGPLNWEEAILEVSGNHSDKIVNQGNGQVQIIDINYTNQPVDIYSEHVVTRITSYKFSSGIKINGKTNNFLNICNNLYETGGLKITPPKYAELVGGGNEKYRFYLRNKKVDKEMYSGGHVDQFSGSLFSSVYTYHPEYFLSAWEVDPKTLEPISEEKMGWISIPEKEYTSTRKPDDVSYYSTYFFHIYPDDFLEINIILQPGKYYGFKIATDYPEFGGWDEVTKYFYFMHNKKNLEVTGKIDQSLKIYDQFTFRDAYADTDCNVTLEAGNKMVFNEYTHFPKGAYMKFKINPELTNVCSNKKNFKTKESDNQNSNVIADKQADALDFSCLCHPKQFLQNNKQQKSLNNKNLTTDSTRTTSRQNVTIYPNPNQGQFVISFNEEQSHAVVELYNSNGHIHYKKTFNNVNELFLDISTMAKGMYPLKIMHDGKVFREKVIYQ